MKTKLIAGLLLAASCLCAAPRIAIGIGVGVPVAPYGYVAPPMPALGYSWVAGYWVGAGPHRVWRAGYWAAPRGHAYVRGGWRR